MTGQSPWIGSEVIGQFERLGIVDLGHFRA